MLNCVRGLFTVRRGKVVNQKSRSRVSLLGFFPAKGLPLELTCSVLFSQTRFRGPPRCSERDPHHGGVCADRFLEVRAAESPRSCRVQSLPP